MKTDVIQTIKDVGVIPVVRATSADEAMRAIDAIREGGISVLEITMTVPNAFSVIEQVTTRLGAMLWLAPGRCWMLRLRSPAFRQARSLSSVLH